MSAKAQNSSGKWKGTGQSGSAEPPVRGCKFTRSQAHVYDMAVGNRESSKMSGE